MFAVYVTHPQVRVDAAVPVPNWSLSDIGIARAERAARQRWVRSLRRIVCSNETKAVETAAILAAAAGLAFEVTAGLHENDRSATGFLPPAEFETAADWFFAHPDRSFQGWERAVDAQTRIVSAVLALLADHDPAAPVAFIGHGAVGTLLKCHLGGVPIARSGDQPAGGGNLFAFDLASRRISCDWTAMEYWQGMDAT